MNSLALCAFSISFVMYMQCSAVPRNEILILSNPSDHPCNVISTGLEVHKDPEMTAASHPFKLVEVSRRHYTLAQGPASPA